jgi:hypothetical protein
VSIRSANSRPTSYGENLANVWQPSSFQYGVTDESENTSKCCWIGHVSLEDGKLAVF